MFTKYDIRLRVGFPFLVKEYTVLIILVNPD
jgi:hypothetical protein